MTTDQATRYLGEVLEFGESDCAADSWLRGDPPREKDRLDGLRPGIRQGVSRASGRRRR